MSSLLGRRHEQPVSSKRAFFKNRSYIVTQKLTGVVRTHFLGYWTMKEKKGKAQQVMTSVSFFSRALSVLSRKQQKNCPEAFVFNWRKLCLNDQQMLRTCLKTLHARHPHLPRTLTLCCTKLWVLAARKLRNVWSCLASLCDLCSNVFRNNTSFAFNAVTASGSTPLYSS